jgi:hypothetical protein
MRLLSKSIDLKKKKNKLLKNKNKKNRTNDTTNIGYFLLLRDVLYFIKIQS